MFIHNKTKQIKSVNKEIEDNENVDIYKMTEINCLFRKNIKNILKELKSFKKRRKELEVKY